MSIPTGDNAFLHELDVVISTELTQAEAGDPEGEAGGWPPDPDAERYEIRLRNLLGAVEALEDGSSAGGHL